MYVNHVSTVFRDMFKTLSHHKDEPLQLPESAILLEALLDTVVFGGFRREVPERNTITFCQAYFAMTHKYDAIWAHQAIGPILRKHGCLIKEKSGTPGFDWFFLACQLNDEMAMRAIMAKFKNNPCTLGHSYCKLHPFSHTNSQFRRPSWCRYFSASLSSCCRVQSGLRKRVGLGGDRRGVFLNRIVRIHPCSIQLGTPLASSSFVRDTLDRVYKQGKRVSKNRGKKLNTTGQLLVPLYSLGS